MLTLAEAQQRAVQHGEGPLLLLGAAGTGKTEALAYDSKREQLLVPN